jgi:hypothetical protein
MKTHPLTLINTSAIRGVFCFLNKSYGPNQAMRLIRVTNRSAILSEQGLDFLQQLHRLLTVGRVQTIELLL